VLTRSELQHLMLIGTYRNNEVTPAHPLMRKLEAIRNASAPCRNSSWARSPETTCVSSSRMQFAASRRTPPRWRSYTGENRGNPFFVIQFLSALADEGLV
jgi:hypothetical protein